MRIALNQSATSPYAITPAELLTIDGQSPRPRPVRVGRRADSQEMQHRPTLPQVPGSQNFYAVASRLRPARDAAFSPHFLALAVRFPLAPGFYQCRPQSICRRCTARDRLQTSPTETSSSGDAGHKRRHQAPPSSATRPGRPQLGATEILSITGYIGRVACMALVRPRSCGDLP